MENKEKEESKRILFSHSKFAKRLNDLTEKLENENGTSYSNKRIVLEIGRKYKVVMSSALLGKYRGYADDYTGDEKDIKDYPAPTLNNIFALANFYNVSIDYLIGRSDSISNNATKMFISKRYGLSNEALDSLRDLVKKRKDLEPYNPAFSEFEVLHNIIKSGLLEDMSEYFNDRFLCANRISNEYQDGSYTEIRKGLFFLRESLIDMFKEFLESVYKDMVKNVPTTREETYN